MILQSLESRGYVQPLRDYIRENRPFFGICLGMQLLFDSSEESPGVEGLRIIPGNITLFDKSSGVKVPQIGWNGLSKVKECTVLDGISDIEHAYFVHSFCAMPTEQNFDWILTTTDYGSQRYISIVQKGNVVAAQFHPEKSGRVGLRMIDNFLRSQGIIAEGAPLISSLAVLPTLRPTLMTNRVIACLDVRSNDDGDLVVTKGDQYDVREANTSNEEGSSAGRGGVRNLGKPVALCRRYYEQGADEVVFLNITSFRQGVVDDLPMLQVLEASSMNVFVPLTVGGGIREYTDPATGKSWSALEVAARYFRAGADKISIGSDAVYAAEAYLQTGHLTGQSAIEQISRHYGAQAVVVSIDPKRVYVSSADGEKTIAALRDGESGPNGEKFCWWQATVKGGRKARDIDAVQLAKACEALGAGEIMLNCIDKDGQGKGYDMALINSVQSAVSIPVIASSGAGNAEHFVDVFQQSTVHAALAAGMFHREEVLIEEVKRALRSNRIPVRLSDMS